jgi:hypothetical protein
LPGAKDTTNQSFVDSSQRRVGPGLFAQEVGPDDVIRVKTTLVNSPVLVIGRDGKFVPNLRREDFEVYENGAKQEIAYFAPVDRPFTVALVIDTSRSTVFNLQDIQHAAALCRKDAPARSCGRGFVFRRL